MAEYYTPDEIATMLKVNLRTVYLWLRQGKINGTKIGDLWRISENDLDEFIAKGRKSNEG